MNFLLVFSVLRRKLSYGDDSEDEFLKMIKDQPASFIHFVILPTYISSLIILRSTPVSVKWSLESFSKFLLWGVMYNPPVVRSPTPGLSPENSDYLLLSSSP